MCEAHLWVPKAFLWVTPLDGKHTPAVLGEVFTAGVGAARKQQLDLLERKCAAANSLDAALDKSMVAGAIREEEGRQAAAASAVAAAAETAGGVQGPLTAAEAGPDALNPMPGMHWTDELVFAPASADVKLSSVSLLLPCTITTMCMSPTRYNWAAPRFKRFWRPHECVPPILLLKERDDVI